MTKVYDRIIIGGGLYGLYAAERCGRLYDEKILLLEMDTEACSRATIINQARIHMGYHYPRSYSTAIKSKNYFNRFLKDYEPSVNYSFKKIYATSSRFSWTNANQFRKFCEATDIRCDDISPETYFKPSLCDGTYITTEYTYDGVILREMLLKEINGNPKITILYNSKVTNIIKDKEFYSITTENGDTYKTPFLLNATYASVNQLATLAGFEPFPIKYELCELIICKASDALKDIGITVMDGPFFSIMPYGKTGYHSLTSVTFTPHVASFESLPTFKCQEKSEGYCTPQQLGNCNNCIAKPQSAWPYMSNLARKYLRDEYDFKYIDSYYSMKPVLKASEIDDSRPTVIKKFSENPTFISILSGKINTVYDLDDVL